MKIGDLVMFTDDGTYAKWFYGQMGIVESTNYAKDGKLHCRVSWLNPVKYFDRFTTTSDFAADKFQVCQENL